MINFVSFATVEIRSVYLQVLIQTSLDQLAVSNNPVQNIICKPSMNKSHTCTTSPQGQLGLLYDIQYKLKQLSC